MLLRAEERDGFSLRHMRKDAPVFAPLKNLLLPQLVLQLFLQRESLQVHPPRSRRANPRHSQLLPQPVLQLLPLHSVVVQRLACLKQRLLGLHPPSVDAKLRLPIMDLHLQVPVSWNTKELAGGAGALVLWCQEAIPMIFMRQQADATARRATM